MLKLDFIYVIYKNIDFIKMSIHELVSHLSNDLEEINIFIIDNSYNHSSIIEIKKFLEFIDKYESSNLHFKYFPSDYNLGFSKACNKAAKFCKSDNIIFLNCDTRFNNTNTEKLVNSILLCSEKSPIVGIKIFDQNNLYCHSCFNFKPINILMKPLNHLDGLIKLIFKKINYLNKIYYLSEEQINSKKVFKVDWISGCFMIINNKFFKEIGGFDERYFMYFEDIDICRRARELGRDVLYDSNASIIHYGQHESRKYRNIFKSILFNKTSRYHIGSWIKYIIKWRKDFLIYIFK